VNIARAKEEIKSIKVKDPTKMELTCYLLGFSDGLLMRQELREHPEGIELTGFKVECPHCGELTPRDAAFCIHCHRKVK